MFVSHTGLWGWGTEADQVVLVIRNIRRAMVEYHDILWDIGYAKTFEEAYSKLENLYAERPPTNDFVAWRDLRVLDEIHWYGWIIDYYMEGGNLYSLCLTIAYLIMNSSLKPSAYLFTACSQ